MPYAGGMIGFPFGRLFFVPLRGDGVKGVCAGGGSFGFLLLFGGGGVYALCDLLLGGFAGGAGLR